MEQPCLEMPQPLAYQARNFFLHAGVRDLFAVVSGLLKQDKFSIVYIGSAPRAGKTHFLVRLAQELSDASIEPYMFEGQQFAEVVRGTLQGKDFSSGDIVLVDNAEAYFASLGKERSGEFVALVESLRSASAKICFVGPQDIEPFVCDEHVGSRLAPALGYQIGSPEAEDTAHILPLMAKQRGILLTDTQVNFLVKRLPRNLAQLESYLQNLDYLSKLVGKPIKKELVAGAV